MLIRNADLQRIAAGAVTLVFRWWRRPTVKAGGTLRTAVGLLAIHAVDVVEPDTLTLDDARAAGYGRLDALRADLAGPAADGATLYRIRLAPAGVADPRDELRRRVDLSAGDVAAVAARLKGFDTRSAHGPWAMSALRAIEARPGTRAGDLAASLGVERTWFKMQVRKLKALGLTESLEVGYRLSPRGRAVLDRLAGADRPATRG